MFSLFNFCINLMNSFFFLGLDVQILPSPTTGAFAAQWKSNNHHHQQQQQMVKQEDKHYSDFSFHAAQTRPNTSSSSSSALFQSSNTACQSVSP